MRQWYHEIIQQSQWFKRSPYFIKGFTEEAELYVHAYIKVGNIHRAREERSSETKDGNTPYLLRRSRH